MNTRAVHDTGYETTALTRRFGDFTVIDSNDSSVQPGMIFGLLGPNVAGKITTIKMQTTLLTPSSGTATVAGYDIARAPVAGRCAGI